MIVLTLHSLGNIYITDYDNNRVRKVAVSTGIITTIAGSGGTGSYSGENGPATAATLNYPTGLTVDSTGKSTFYSVIILFIYAFSHLGNVYIADTENDRIRKVTASTPFPR